MVLHCILVIVYIALVKPFELPLLNRLEVFNEVCIIGAAYHLFLFTEYVSDPELQYSIGWSIIGVTVLNIAVNMIIMLKTSFARLRLQYKKLRYQFRVFQLKRKKAKIEDEKRNETA